MASFVTDQPRTRKRKPLESLPDVVTQPKLRKVLIPTKTVLQSPTVTTSDGLPTIDVDHNIKISSWNVAGLRAWVKKDGMEFLKEENPDIFCLQVKLNSAVFGRNYLYSSNYCRKRNVKKMKFLSKLMQKMTDIISTG